MGYWQNTTYLQHGSVAEVANRLAALFGKERMTPIDTPRPRAHGGIREPMQYADALHNDLWGVAVFPGAPSWTVVKTAPLELLGERRPGADRMRLAEACAALGASALQVNVYDSVGIVLVEVSPEGEAFLSGFNDRGPDNFAWHSERIDEAMAMPQLRLHPFRDVLGDGLHSTKIAQGLAARLGAGNAAFCDNVVSVDTLVTHKPLAVRGGIVSYFQWQGPSRVRVKSG
jgi:hypothetical protein